MRTYGIQLAEGSTLKNATIDNGIVFPDLPSPGEMFFRSDLETLWFYTGLSWEQLGGAVTAVSFVTANPEPGSPASRQAVGATNQIVLTDNGPASTISFALAPNLIMPGTGAATMVSGTTEQRPAPAPGMLRFNTSTSMLETAVGASWQSMVMSDDERLGRDDHVLEVRVTPKSTQFGSIAAACASLSGIASATEHWLVEIGPGQYVEPEIVVPPYVHVSGFTQYAIHVSPLGTTHPIFSMGGETSLSFINITDALAPDQAAVRIWNTDGDVILHKVSVVGASIGFDIKSMTADTFAYLEYCDTTQSGGIGIKIDGNTGFSTYVNLENFYCYGDVTNMDFGIKCDGPNVYVNMQSYGIEGEAGTGTGVFIVNGSRVEAKAGSIFGWDIGVHLPNQGLPSIVNFVGTPLHSNTTWDLLSDHPGNTGTLSGTATRAKVNAVESPSFTSNFADVENNEYVQTGSLYMGKTQAELTNVTDLIIETPPMGILSGGALSPAGGLNVAISAGVGYLRKDGAVTRIDWANNTITLAANTTMYIFVNKHGVVLQSLSVPDLQSNIVLGRGSAGASSVTGLGSTAVNIKSHGNQLENYLRTAVGPVYVSGSIVTENLTTPRAIDITGGVWFYGTNQRNPSAKVAAPIVAAYRAGGVTTTSTISVIPNNTIDNGTDLVAVTPGYFTKHALYCSSEGIFQIMFMSHAQSQYATLLEAEDAPLPVPRIAPEGTPLVAAVIMQEGVNSIVEIRDVRPMFMRAIAGTVGSTSDHGDLTGLSEDDHPQYMLVSGARALAGDLDLAMNDLLNVGTVNGLSINTHGSRHAPQGADPIPTAPAISLSSSTVNSVGIANTLARSDHTHAITGFQPASTELDALTSISMSGILVHVEPDVWITRALTGTTNRVVVTNGNGVTANPTIDLSTVGTAGTFAQITTDAYGRVISGAATLNWTAIAGHPTTLAGYEITDAQPKNTLLTTLSNIATTGLFAITASGTGTTRAIIPPLSGITVTNANGVAGNPILALSNDLAALEGLQTSGFAVRQAPDIWTTRFIAGVSGNITVTNGGGLIADPLIDLAPAGTAGTYGSVVTDSFGRVIGGTSRSRTVAQVQAISVAGGTTTALIPSDNTIPLSTEGASFATITITPTLASSTIVGTFTCWVDSGTQNRNITAAVFRGTICIATSSTNIATSGRPQNLTISFTDLPASASPVTYTLRVGANTSATVYVNTSSTFTMGGAGDSAFILSEILA